MVQIWYAYYSQISTIQQPINEMAELAVTILDNRINGKADEATLYTLPVKLIEGKTC